MQADAVSGGATATLPSAAGATAFRRLYARAADAESVLPGGELIDLVRSELLLAGSDSRQPLDGLIREAAGWSSAAAERFTAMPAGCDRDGHRLLLRRAALGWAPLGLAAGAWLQWLSSPGTGDLPLNLRILALYAADVGAGHPGAARRDGYLGLLRALRVSENAVPLARLAGDPRIADAAFRVPAVLLLMSRRPDDFCAELLGADLCLRAVGLPPPLALARDEPQADWPALDYSAARDGGPAPIEQCRAVADALIQDGPELAARLYAGFGWTLAALRDWSEALHDELRASLDPGYDMAELLRLRAREGSVYHRRVMLGDRPLAGWLKDARSDPQPLLDALARSDLITPGRSADSPLVTELVSEAGPMFRIFSPDDLIVISRWIDALPAGSGRPPAGEPPPAGVAAQRGGQASTGRRLELLPELLDGPSPAGGSPSDLREAYTALMARSGNPALRDWCLQYIRGWLRRSRYRMDSRSVPLPREWTMDGLRSWLLTQHDKAAGEFDETADAPPPSREAVIDDAVQLAPLTLIDGSWLQGFTDYELASSEIGHSLFAIYWDELGNGEASLNHPRIYREVLRGMGVDLPPTASPEFARWTGFRDESFELPVYWLCIGRFPRTFLPELLGLNLAMELSGVGGGYRTASIALRKHGFSTRFVDIHNTIDNVATGHSAWATDAIDTLMARLPDSLGPGGRAEVWQRVRTGYRSLNPPGGFRARRAGRRGASRGWRPNGARSMSEAYLGV
jgi:Iron-containing redox enzyme